MKKLTIHDIARLAGVSASVVSTALSGGTSTTRVSETTRERIRAIAHKHRYMPNVHARAVRNSVRATGFVSARWDNAYENDIKQHVQRACAGAGKDIHFITYPAAPDGQFTRWLASFNYARIILLDVWRQLTATAKKDVVKMFDEVMVLQRSDSDAVSKRVSFCDIDTAQVISDVFSFARAKGRKHIAALITEKSVPSQRADALRAIAAADSSFSFTNDAYEIVQENLSSVYDAARVIAGKKYDCIFSHNDQLAPVVYKAIHDAGKNIPEDIAVIGMDDIPLSAYLLPPLTTVRIHREDFGTQCLRWLSGEITDMTIRHELVERESI